MRNTTRGLGSMWWSALALWLLVVNGCGDAPVDAEGRTAASSSALRSTDAGLAFDADVPDTVPAPLNPEPRTEDGVVVFVLGAPVFGSESLAQADDGHSDDAQEMDAGAPDASADAAASRWRRFDTQDIRPLVDEPDFELEVRTCSGSAPPIASDKAYLTIQAGGEAFAWNLPGSRLANAISRFQFRWPSAVSMSQLQSLKLELEGAGSWCVNRLVLRWFGANRAALNNPQELWSWSSSVTQPSATYLHGHSPNATSITLDNDLTTQRAAFARFTLPTTAFEVATSSRRCLGALSEAQRHKRGFCIETCSANGSGAGLNSGVQVAVKHDNLWDFLSVKPGEVDQQNDVATVGFNNFCAIRNLQSIRLQVRPQDPWSVCELYYHDYQEWILRLPPDPTASAVVSPLASEGTACTTSNGFGFYRMWTSGDATRTTSSTTGAYTYAINQNIDPCTTGDCVTARQGFELALNSRVKACLEGSNPVDNTCDGVDQDCDGLADEHYVGGATSCGTGACARTGTRFCFNGEVNSGCTPGTPATEVCDTADNDCDGSLNESLQRSTSCGVGVCAASVPQTCSTTGAWLPACTPANGNAVTERSGNGLDDDCDGQTDEPTPESCTDGYDNDNDGQVDCDDLDCGSYVDCRGEEEDDCDKDYDCSEGLICILPPGMSGGSCRRPSCANGIHDPDELRLDCGGELCPPCSEQAECEARCNPGEQGPAPAKQVLSLSWGAFSRASTATYADDRGRLQTSRANELRFADFSGRRLALIEGPGRNYLRQESQLAASPWTSAGGHAMAIASDVETAPDQSMSADLLASGGVPSRSRQQRVSVPAGTASLSMWLRGKQERSSNPRFVAVHTPDPRTGATPAPSTAELVAGKTWTRAEASLVMRGAADVLFSHDAGWPSTAFRAVDADDFYAWGLQLEASPFPTSFMPTASAEGTRAGDRLTINSAAIPAWIASGPWQIDVRPLFSSAEATAGTRYALLSWSTGSIALLGQGSTSALQVRIGTTTQVLPLSWDRGDILTLTVYPQMKTVAVAGAKAGNGQLVFSLPLNLTMGFTVGSNPDFTNAAFAGFSDVRLVDSTSVTCDATRNVCNATCPCEPGEGPVAGPEQCAEGLIPRSDVAWHFGLPDGTTTCWDPECDGPLKGRSCGAVADRCGLCPVVDICNSDIDCDDGEACGTDNGWAFGLLGRVCWPRICQDEDFRNALCGNHDELCGTCPADQEGESPVCIPDCSNKSCGSDGCGGSCGQCTRKDDDDPPTDVGAVDVGVSVGIDGNARVQIPLHAMPARQGIAPSLDLSYDSLRGQSALGFGWGLDGLSQITRCPHQTPRAASLGPSTEWGYCLDGARLIPYARRAGVIEPKFGSFGPVDVISYHLESDTAVRLEHAEGHDFTASSFDAWTVEYRDGRVAQFHDLGVRHLAGRQTPDLRSEGPAAIWFLTRMEDTFGNYYNVEYATVLSRHERIPAVNDEGLEEEVFEVYPKKIFFTGHRPSGLQPTRSIEFEYDQPVEQDELVFPTEVAERFLPVGDAAILSRHGGGEVAHEPDGLLLRTSKALTKVTLQLNERKVMQYRLKYERAEESRRVRLHEVRQCAGATRGSICKPPVTLSWSTPGSRVRVGSFRFDPEADEKVPDMHPADLDGDGVSELVYVGRGVVEAEIPDSGDYQYTLHIVRNLGSDPVVVDTGVQAPMTSEQSIQVFDMNRDGRSDVQFTIYARGESERRLQVISVMSEYDPDGFTYKRHTYTSARALERSDSVALVDMNGDTYPDMLSCGGLDFDGLNGTWQLALADPTQVATYGEHQDLGFGCVSPRNLSGTMIPIWGQPMNFGEFRYTPRVNAAGPLLMDFDGDAVPEIVWKDGTTQNNLRPDGVYKLAVDSDGSVHYDQVATLPPEVSSSTARPGVYLTHDVNGDGLLDVLFMRPYREDLDAPLEGSVPPRAHTWVSFNNGHTLLPPVFAFEHESPYAPDSQVPIIAFLNATSIDWNGDGRTELVLLDNLNQGDTSRWKMFSWRGTHFAQFGEPIASGYNTGLPNRAVMPVAVNLFGVGNDYVLPFSSDGLLFEVHARRSAHQDLLTAISIGTQPGSAITHSLSYSTTHDPDVYEYHSQLQDDYTCIDWHLGNFRSGCVRGRLVVKERSTRSDDEVYEHTRESYFYRNGRVNLDGRGFLGFDAREVTVPALKSRRAEWFDTWTVDADTAFPLYRGMPIHETMTLNENAEADDSDFAVVPWREDISRVMGFHQASCSGTFCGLDAKKSFVVWPETTRREVSEYRGDAWHVLEGSDRTQTVDLLGNTTRSAVGFGDESFVAQTEIKPVATWSDRWLPSRPESVTLTSCIQDNDCTRLPCPRRCRQRSTEYVYHSDGTLQFTKGEFETEHKFDDYGNLIELIAKGSTHGRAPAERHSTLEYDGPGEVEFIFPRAKTNAVGHRTELLHHPVFGGVLEEEFDGVRTVAALDGFGRLKETSTSKRGEKTELFYEQGESYPTVREVVHGGTTTTSVYDALGRHAQTVSTAAGGAKTFVDRAFDPTTGAVSSITLPYFEGESSVIDEEYTYDAIGRLSVVTHADTGYKRIEYQGNRTRVTDERGYIRDFYREHGKIVRVEDPEVLGRRTTTTYEYGPFGLLTRSVNDQEFETVIGRDDYGRPVSVGVTGQPAVSNIYNAFGELEESERLTANWNQVYTRDAIGRLLTKTDGSDTNVTQYIWDTAAHGQGLLQSTSSPSGVVETYTYDDAKRSDTIAMAVDAQVFSVRVAERDDFGRVTRRELPKGPTGQAFTLRYAYDDDSGDMTDIWRVLEGGTERRVWGLTSTHADGSVHEEVFGNGAATTRGLDPARMFLESITTKIGEQTVQNMVHRYDVAGNLSDRYDYTLTDAPGGHRREQFGLDALNRLDYVVLYNGDRSVARYGEYDYDFNGNLTRHPGNVAALPGEELRYEDGLRPNAVTSVPGRYEIGTLEFDVLGRLERKGSLHLAYDNDSNPSRVWNDDEGIDKRFKYNASGALSASSEGIVEADPGTATYYFGRAYEVTLNQGSTTHRYHVWNEDRAVATFELENTVEPTERVSYLHIDHLGSVVASSDGAGLVKKQSFGPFGKARDANWMWDAEGAESQFGYTSHSQADLGSFGLVRAGARIYDPDLVTFYQPDPIVSEPLNSQDFNLYAYVRNSPLSLVDPDGMAEYGATARIREPHPFASDVVNASAAPTSVGPVAVDPPDAKNRAPREAAPSRRERTPPPEVSTGGDGTDTEGTDDEASDEALQEAMEGLGLAVAEAIAEQVIPGLSLVNSIDTLFDDNASALDRGLAVVDIAMTVMPVKAGAAIKGIAAVGSAIGAVATVVAKQRKVVAKVRQVGSTVASKAKAVAQRVGRETGSYTNVHASGKTYSGKGGRSRSQASGRRVAAESGDPHVATDFTPAPNAREAFKQESRRLDANGGVASPNNYNKVESPGRAYRIQDGEL